MAGALFLLSTGKHIHSLSKEPHSTGNTTHCVENDTQVYRSTYPMQSGGIRNTPYHAHGHRSYNGHCCGSDLRSGPLSCHHAQLA